MNDNQDNQTKARTVKSALESMMFVWGSPLPAATAAEVIGVDTSYIRQCAAELREEYEARGSGLAVREINGGFQLCTRAENEEYIAELCTPVRTRRLSNPAMEVLTIIAYKQPVSRSEIDFIRGLKSENVLYGLQRKGLIEEKGRGTGLGRPVLFGTTELFLEKFGISSLKELPQIEEYSASDMAGEQVSLDEIYQDAPAADSPEKG